MRFHALVCALSALLPGSFRGCASGAMAATSPFLLGNSIKTAMANERTFFKWLFFGFHIGAVRYGRPTAVFWPFDFPAGRVLAIWSYLLWCCLIWH